MMLFAHSEVELVWNIEFIFKIVELFINSYMIFNVEIENIYGFEWNMLSFLKYCGSEPSMI